MASDARAAYQTSLLAIIGDRPIAYHPKLAKIVGGVKAAILLSQLLYWAGDKSVQKRDGWVYKSVEDMEDETGLTKYEQQSARGELEDKSIIECKLKGIPRIWHYRIDMDALGGFIIQWDSRSMEKPPSLGGVSTQLNKVTETTAETTDSQQINLLDTQEKSQDSNGEKDLGTEDLISATEEKKKEKSKQDKNKKPPKPPKPPHPTALDSDDPRWPILEATLQPAANNSELRYAQAVALAEVCGMEIEPNKGRLFKEAVELDKYPSDIKRLFGKPGGGWYRYDWRGKKGQPPTLAQVREYWLQMEKQTPPNSGNNSALNQPENYVTMDKTPRGESTRILGGARRDPVDGGYDGL